MSANTRLVQSYCDTRCNNPICYFLFFFAQVLENHQLPSSIYLQRKSVNNSKPSDSKHPYLLSLVVDVVIITLVRVLRVGTWCWNEPRDSRFLCMGVKPHSQQLSFVHYGVLISLLRPTHGLITLQSSSPTLTDFPWWTLKKVDFSLTTLCGWVGGPMMGTLFI